jgi:hypothetical protein
MDDEPSSKSARPKSVSNDTTPATDFFTDVRRILADARRTAVSAVNSAMVAAYWQIGRRNVEEEQGGRAQAAYGEGLLRALSKELTAEFGKGFSLANLKNLRKFYLTYPDGRKCYALRSFLSWTHHRLIMRVESTSAREYYIARTEKGNWSTRTLTGQFDDLKRGPDDNPTIGLILCADKDETIVQYSVLKGSEQLFASKDRTVLRTEAELTAELERERRVIEQQREGGEE